MPQGSLLQGWLQVSLCLSKHKEILTENKTEICFVFVSIKVHSRRLINRLNKRQEDDNEALFLMVKKRP